MKNSIILVLVGSTLASASKDNQQLSAFAGGLIIAGVIGFKLALVKK